MRIPGRAIAFTLALTIPVLASCSSAENATPVTPAATSAAPTQATQAPETPSATPTPAPPSDEATPTPTEEPVETEAFPSIVAACDSLQVAHDGFVDGLLLLVDGKNAKGNRGIDKAVDLMGEVSRYAEANGYEDVSTGANGMIVFALLLQTEEPPTEDTGNDYFEAQRIASIECAKAGLDSE